MDPLQKKVDEAERRAVSEGVPIDAIVSLRVVSAALAARTRVCQENWQLRLLRPLVTEVYAIRGDEADGRNPNHD